MRGGVTARFCRRIRSYRRNFGDVVRDVFGDAAVSVTFLDAPVVLLLVKP